MKQGSHYALHYSCRIARWTDLIKGLKRIIMIRMKLVGWTMNSFFRFFLYLWHSGRGQFMSCDNTMEWTFRPQLWYPSLPPSSLPPSLPPAPLTPSFPPCLPPSPLSLPPSPSHSLLPSLPPSHSLPLQGLVHRSQPAEARLVCAVEAVMEVDESVVLLNILVQRKQQVPRETEWL